MSTVNFNLRGLDSDLMSILKLSAEKQNASVNSLILKCIEQGLGYSRPIARPAFHDLDALAGTWNKEDAKEFNQNTVFFEKIDEDLWS